MNKFHTLVEQVVIQMSSINIDDVASQQLAVTAIASIDNDLRLMFTQRTIIWDQLIRCFGEQERKPMTLLVSKLKYWQQLTSSTSHTLSSHSLALLEKSLVCDLPAKRFYRYSQEILSTLIMDLKKYNAQLKRDHSILLDEQRLIRALQKNQNDVLIFLEKLSSGLIEKKTNSEFGFIAPDILYTLKVKLNELRLQVAITEKSSVNLDLIQRKNQALISSISVVLAPSLNTLIHLRDFSHHKSLILGYHRFFFDLR